MRGPSRAVTIGICTAIALVLPAAPALADPAVPTEYESRITGLEPATEAVSVDVVGGDAFLQLKVAPGHTAELPGYFGEPYLRVDETGSVSINTRSPSKHLNEDRYGESTVPDSADADAEPEWHTVASDGRYAWHDHRTHWMNPDRPPGVTGDEAQVVFEWEIPLTVDGVATLASGTLVWHPQERPLWWLAAGLPALAAVAFWRRGGARVLAFATAVAALIAGVLAATEWLATPAAARAFPLVLVPPVFALAILAAAVVVASRRPITAVQAVVVGCVALIVYVFGALDVFTKAILPSALPDAVERVSTAAVAWLALAGAVIATLELLTVAGETPAASAPLGDP